MIGDMTTPEQQPEYVPPPPRGSGVGMVIAIIAGALLLVLVLCGAAVFGIGWTTYRTLEAPPPIMVAPATEEAMEPALPEEPAPPAEVTERRRRSCDRAG